MTTAALLRIRIPSRTPSHTLRALCVLTFPFALVFLLVHGIVSKQVVPAIGLVPMFLSTIYSAFLLYNDKTFGGETGVLSGTPLHLLLDLLLAGGLLAVLVLSWVFVPRGYKQGWRYIKDGWIMFGTYCTVWLMINCGIHFYFTLMQIAESMSGLQYGHTCPHCHHSERYVQPRAGMSTGKGKAYQPLLSQEEGRQGLREEYDADSDAQETGLVGPEEEV